MSKKHKIFIQQGSGAIFMFDPNLERRADMKAGEMTHEEIADYGKKLSAKIAKDLMTVAPKATAKAAYKPKANDEPDLGDDTPAATGGDAAILSLDAMDTDKLREYAKTKNIALPPNLKNPDKIREIIREIMLPPPAPDPSAPPPAVEEPKDE